MHMRFLKFFLIILIGTLTACPSSSNRQNGVSSRGVSNRPQEQQIIGNIPNGAPFSKLTIGMSPKQVHDLIGEPTDTLNRMTGKAFIPYYFGRDVMRLEELYKGQGRLIFTGSGMGGENFHVYQIVYDPHEDGYNNL